MMPTTYNILCLVSFFFSLTVPPTFSSSGTRRILHQPFFPKDSIPPDSSPQSQPKKLPFSSSSSSSPSPTQKSFFPFYHSPPTPPSPTAIATFPANISSLLFPQPSSPSRHPIIPIAVSVSLFSAALVVLLIAFIYYRRHRNYTTAEKASRSDSLRLYPPNTVTSDGHKPRNTSSASASTSSEFLYLGTVVNSREACGSNGGVTMGTCAAPYRKLGSPELKPLPPLPRHRNRGNGEDDDEEEEFFSPRGSSGRRQSPGHPGPGKVLRLEVDKFGIGNRSFNSRTPSYPCSNSPSVASSPGLNLSPRHSSEPQRPMTSSSPSSPEINGKITISGLGEISEATIGVSVPIKMPPTPPPLPPPRFWEASTDNNEEARKPKLKPLHWDKVRASSDRAMVWDQLKPSSFQLNEEMIETLFMANKNNTSNFTHRDARRQIVASSPLEYRVLDPKKSHNIAILLRALNVTIDEVCEALREGNWDMLGTELLESLLKMAPTKDEECKLKEFKDEPPHKLGLAEKFLKVVLDIPFAFKRVEAMLYIANFDSELEYLRKSFETLEVACEELRNSRMFLKLLEAVLRTGNRMNVGTNRGDAHAFKLDTLLKLVDIKGIDGKTTLLHFVVQEIVRTEGSRISGANNHQTAEKIQQSTLQDEVEYRKLGLQVVSSLSGELCNVKKAAAMDSEMLSSDITKLARGIAKVAEVIKLNEESPLREASQKFSQVMKGFLKKGEEEIVSVQAQEKNAFSSVKELTEYFHGNSSKEEAHPFRIFLVVRDFLSILDRVCKEVGKVNERTLVGFRQYSMPTNPILPPIFPEITGKQQPSGSSDDESSSRSS